MFQSLGNLFTNSVWEELLQSTNTLITDDTAVCSPKASTNKLFHARKPEYDDPISLKERFIHAKYSEKVFVHRVTRNRRLLSVEQQVWESICANDQKAVYRHIVRSGVDINVINGQALDGNSFNMTSSTNPNIASQSTHQLLEDIQEGSSLLHLACLTCDAGMVELLLQYGADVNAIDSRGRTPLHYCILRGKIAAAKVLITRGANPHLVDKEGNTPLKLASEPSTVGNEIDSILTSTT